MAPKQSISLSSNSWDVETLMEQLSSETVMSYQYTEQATDAAKVAIEKFKEEFSESLKRSAVAKSDTT